MQIKKYRAADMHEALQKVKKDLGADAIILSTRQVRGGGATFGLFGKPMLEVTAAREMPGTPGDSQTLLSAMPQGVRNKLVGPPSQDGSAPESDLIQQMLSKNRLDAQTLLAPLQDEIHELREILQTVGKSQRNVIRDDSAIQQMQSDIAEMRGLLNTLSTQSTTLNTTDFPDNLVALYQQLTFNGMEEKFSHRLIEEAQKSIPQKEMEDFSYVKIFMARMLMKIIRVTGGVQTNPEKQKVIALVGPTGVGKTTTVAKLASEQMLKYRKNVALITVDTFRIAAVEQLKVYAKIMGVPITVVQGREEMHQAIEKFSEADVIFIDTGGRSQRDELQMSEIYQLFGGEDRVDVYLALTASTKDTDMSEITRRFNEIDLAGIVFTKLDEATGYGSLFNHAIRFKLPIAYLTTGQKVPEDIEVATKERMVDLLLNITST